MFFKYFMLPYSVAKSGTAQALPKDAECMIQTLEVNLGGERVNQITNYNQIFNLLSLYGFDAEFRASRDNYLNVGNNGRTSTVADLDGVQFCCEKWLGLLGLPVVLDTHTLGQLHIRITLAPALITTSNSTLHSWGMSDIFMRVKYYENYNGDLPSHIEFDDFKSILDRAPSHNQKTTLLVNASRIDYILARVLRFDAFSKATVLATSTGNVLPFATTAGNVDTWNISVNNNQLFKYRPTVPEGIKTVMDFLKTKSVNAGIQYNSAGNAFERNWVCGAELGFISEIPTQAEIAFTTEGLTTAACFPLLIVKTTRAIEIGKHGEVVHKV